MGKLIIKTSSRGIREHKERERHDKDFIYPKLYEKCFSCRRSFEKDFEIVWCKLKNEEVKATDTCEKGIWYYKRKPERVKKSHAKGK